MKILVTGLCMSGNKGGPAIALSLMKVLRTYCGDAEFVFSVPPGAGYAHEEQWAATFGVRIVPDFSWSGYIFPFSWFADAEKKKRTLDWMNELRNADLLLEMSAISYVGPPIRSVLSAVLAGRTRYVLAARCYRKTFLAWTQSYGPFSTALIRLVARWDLRRLPMIFCRGQDSLAVVQQLIPGAEVYAFPDVAILLDYDRAKGETLLQTLVSESHAGNVVTISPSAVLQAKSRREGWRNTHGQLVAELIVALTQKGLYPVMIPHTLYVGCEDPEVCDYALCQEVLRHLEQTGTAGVLLCDDLSPCDLKSIISGAVVHVGARYHSIVAALSTGVPCIALSWHPKYRDIMEPYGLEGFVLEGRELGPIVAAVDSQVALQDHLRDQLHAAQIIQEREVGSNADKFWTSYQELAHIAGIDELPDTGRHDRVCALEPD